MKIGFGACSRSENVKFGQGSDEWRRDGFPDKREHDAFKRWAKTNNLNQFGDPEGTVYAGGDPLFFSMKTLYQYASENHPQKPWVQKPE